MLKICYFVNSDWYFDLHWLERALAVKETGYQVYIISDFINSDIFEKLTSLGFNCIKLKVHSQSMNPFSFLNSMRKLVLLLNQISPDILHCITIKPCILGGLYSLLKKKKAVFSFVGLGRLFDADSFTLKIIKKITIEIYKVIFKNPEIFLVFEHEADRISLIILTNVSPSKTIVIDGAGINTELFPYQHEPVNSKPVVLFASRLLWSKGLGDLVKVKDLLASRDIHFILNVAGIKVDNDKDAIPLSVIHEWSDSGKIEWLGKSDHVVELIRQANLVVLPSIYSEGVPRILLESSATGRACISYDSGGCSSLIQNGLNGFLVSKGDIESLAKAIQTLIKDSVLRKEMGLKGREFVMDRFSSAIVIEHTIGLYTKLLSS